MSDERILLDFVAKYAEPYVADTDTYDEVAFTWDTKEGKNASIYTVHSYHTKVPPRAIVPYILHYTDPGDVVLDPFCGTGMTGVAALMCEVPPFDLLDQFPELKDRTGLRRAILNDLSPVACHIARNYTTPVDIDAFAREITRIKASVEDRFAWLYATEHYEPAVGAYDPVQPDVLRRLKNPPQTGIPQLFEGHASPDWELIDRTEVERRLGYSVTNLSREKHWGSLDISTVDSWICIPGTIQYAVWSDIYRCEGLTTIEEPTGKTSRRGINAGKPIVQKRRVQRGCGSDLVLWHMARDRDTEEIFDSFKCPTCGWLWEKVDLPWVGMVPVVTDYTWIGLDGRRYRQQRALSCYERLRIKEAQPELSGLWYPSHKIYPYRELMTMSANKRGVASTSDFYTPRNLFALAILWSAVDGIVDARLRSFGRFIFTAIIPYVCRKQNYGGGGGGMSGTLYLPSFHQEKNVWEVFLRKVEKVCAEFATWKVAADAVLTVQGSAAKLNGIPDSCVDYIFTDPPFGGNIFYADASLLWESWLGTFTDERQEMVYHRRSRQRREADGYVFKTLSDYAKDMSAAFKEMFRVLKPGRWATIEFNNSDGSVFEAIKTAVRSAGFEIVNMLLMDKEQKTFKQVQGAKGEQNVVDKDVLFNLRKPATFKMEVSGQDSDLEREVSHLVQEYLRALPERIATNPEKYTDDHRTTATINSMLMNALIPKGVSVERLNLAFIERICSRYFRKIGHRWFLRGEAVGNQLAPSNLIGKEIVIKDEVSSIEWIRQRLKEGPTLTGELRPQWMLATGPLPVAVSQQLDLEELLEQNFWKDPGTNRWREPTEAERELMNDDRSIRVLHDAERFNADTLRRFTSDKERSEWIDILFKACNQVEDKEVGAVPSLRGFDERKGYLLITRLFQSVLKDNVDPEVYRRVQKQAQVASQRLNVTLENEKEKVKANQRKESGPTLFEGIEDE